MFSGPAGETGATTAPALREWPRNDHRYRRSEVSAIIGREDDVWERAVQDVLRWGVKTASGFTVDSPGPVSVGSASP